MKDRPWPKTPPPERTPEVDIGECVAIYAVAVRRIVAMPGWVPPADMPHAKYFRLVGPCYEAEIDDDEIEDIEAYFAALEIP